MYDNIPDLGPLKIMGLEVHVAPPSVMIERLWRERLLSWPWRPWVATRWVANPSLPARGEVWRVSGNLVVRREDYMRLVQETRA